MASLNDIALRLLIGAEDKTGPGIKSARDGIQSINDQLKKVENLARNFLSIRIFAGLAKDGIELIDTYRELQARTRQVVGETGNLAAVQKQLFRISQDAAAPLRDTVNLYARSAEALKKLNDGQALAAKLTETVNLSFKAQASTTTDMSSTVIQLTQAIGTGTVTWEDFGNVAQSNLLLANTAAKNLGYDGISSLKKAISEGKVSGEDMTRAIVAGFDEIKARADAMPIGVSRAMVQIDNALIKFVGESNAANTASKALSGGLQLVAGNINTLANAALVLAELYAVRLAGGLATSGRAMLASAAAAREKAAADIAAQRTAQALLITEARVAALRVKTAAAAVQEARLYAAIVAGTEKEVAAKKALTVAINQLHAAQTKSAAANAGLSVGIDTLATKPGLAGKAIGLLSKSVQGLVAITLATTLADWMLNMDWFYKASLRVQEGMVLLLTGAKAMVDGLSARERWDQIQAIHQEFNAIIEKNGKAAREAAAAVTEAEQQKAQATEAAATQQAAAFDRVQKATQALTAQIDADAKAQTTALQQALADRLAAIDASNATDAAKDAQRVEAKLQAAEKELLISRQTVELKINLIDQEYAAEEAKAQGNARRMEEVESAKKQAKLDVYRGVADFYAGEVTKLSTLFDQETAAFAKSKQDMQALAADHEHALLALDRRGMTERQQLASQQLEYNRNIAKLNAEIRKGDKADQAEINRLLTSTKSLQTELSSAEIGAAQTSAQRSIAIYNAKKRENEIYDAQKQILADNTEAHQKNAKSIETALTEAKAQLENANKAIKDITAQLDKEYLFKMGLDEASAQSVRNALAELTKPETKIITVKTVNAGTEGPQPQGGGFGVPAQSTGGPVKFAQGGWARMAGLLSGYGGGDRRRALLEDGEFVVRKEAVRKVGVPLLQAINQGAIPEAQTLGGVIRRASGGSIDEEVEKKFRERQAQQLKKLLTDYTYENANRWFAGNRFNNAGDMLMSQIREIGAQQQIPGDLVQQAMDAAKYLPRAYPNPGNDPTIKNRAVKEGLAYQAAIDALGKLPPKEQRPTFKVPTSVTGKLATDTGQGTTGTTKSTGPASSKLLQGAKGGGALDKTVTVQFQSPQGGAPVKGLFAENDVDRLLQTLKDAAGAGMVGAR